MRFMILLKATADSEADVLPGSELLAAMGKYNEELVQAGVMLAGEGLRSSARGARVHFSGTERTVSHGPFSDTAGLIAGFWMFDVQSLDEAIAWVRRCPFSFDGGGTAEIEIRQVFEAEDFGAAFTPEQRAAEERMRAHLQQHGKPPGPRH